MPFDQPTRNLLQRTVSRCRDILAGRWDSPADGEFFKQLQEIYGISPDGTAAPLEVLEHLSDEDLETARVLREILEHYTSGLIATGKKPGEARREAVLRLAREQAFTVLNRLAALRMAEERGIVLECVRQGLQSEGFQLFQQSAGTALGSTPAAYRTYLFVLFDELSRDLGVLFNRFDKSSLLFPRHAALEAILRELNGTGTANKDAAFSPAQISALWAEDEAIGWIYQYYNDESERKKMREESSAPRNSRELAVRNQFFTPRYVVEFLTDNTLGRIWYEMTKGRTRLKEQCKYLVRRPTEVFLGPEESAPEVSSVQSSVFSKEATENSKLKTENLSQEELLLEPVHIPHRPLKDPRSILMLDPACGSMHFGLYAFDLFEVIYEEFWDLHAADPENFKLNPENSRADSLFSLYATKGDFLRDVPRLIIENNLHGIDIDPRATQIAGLSLWLRAHKSWQKLGVPMAERPQVRRSNLVCAEPMPGEKEMLREFVEQQFPAAERPAFAFLLEKIFDRMTLAGEAGSLLRIEEEIRTAIAEARALAQSQSSLRQGQFFAEHKKPEQSEFDLRGLNDEQFWQAAEQRIYDALEAYAEQAERGGGFQRRLFADDAAQGFAFIDLCRKRYDVAVMNPPFGLMGMTTYKYAVESYPNSYCDFGIAFMDRGLMWTGKTGLVGAITSRSFLSVTDAEKFRVNVAIPTIQLIVDLGLDVMDGAWVDSCCQIFTAGSREPFIQFVKVRGEILTPELLVNSSRQILRGRSDFLKMPRARLSYEVGNILANVLATGGDGIEETGVALNRTGASTFEDERFRRIWWEVRPTEIGAKKTWCFVAKSCEFNLFYYPYENLVKWNCNGDELAERNRQVNEQTAQARQGSTFYFKPGLSFSRRGEPTIAFRTYPASCAFSSNGAVVLPHDMRDALYLLGLLNSSWIRAAIHTQAHKFSYSVGHPKAIKWVAPSGDVRDSVEESTRGILEHKRRRFSKDDRDSNFVLPFDPAMSGINEWFQTFRETCQKRDKEMETKLSEIDSKIAETYALSAEQIDWKTFNTSVVDVHDPNDIPFSSVRDFGSCVFAYICGTILGRWDIRYATGERPAPELPDPFAPLPVCPPGMLQDADGLPLSPEAGRKLRAENQYPIDVVWDGILVDDPEHPLDLERQVRAVLTVLWGDQADALEHEACALLGVSSLRDYFRRPSGFFADHLKRYSKSRRQAPIYWPLSTASGSYTLWIYYHRLTPDTLYKCLQQFVEPKIREVETNLTRLRAMDDAGEGGRQTRDQLAKAETLRTEILALRDELAHWAPRWKPNLNDGVQITASPLWKLFLLPKWRKTLEQTWKELDRGDYDWAHLAHTLHPARVREKCKTDRSLAIAHSLEDLCQIQAPAPKKKRGKKAKDEEELI